MDKYTDRPKLTPEQTELLSDVVCSFLNAVTELPTLNPNARIHDICQRLTDMTGVTVSRDALTLGLGLGKVRHDDSTAAIASLPKGYAAVKKALKARQHV